MKLSKIAFASLVAVGVVNAFAATAPLACDKTSAVAFVNTCAPAATFYVAGSSALGGAISKVITASSTSGATGYFDTSVVPFVATVVDNGTANGVGKANPTQLPSTKAGDGVTAWFGMSKGSLTGGTSVPVLVVYNSYMGSAAGVSQVLAPVKSLSTIPESDVVKVGPTGTVKNTCIAYDSTTPTASLITVAGTTTVVATAANKVACTSHAVTQADLAISDVDVTELVSLYPEAAKTSLAKFTRKPLAMQGFAVAVNPKFYADLQAAQVTAGALPSTCTNGTYSEACQPNITRAQYASLVSNEGSIKSAAGFIPGSTETLTLARRDQLSGTQASSNMFFLANSCNLLDAKSKINTHGGALTALRGADDKGVRLTNLPTGLVVNENVQTGGVEADLKAETGYSIGVIALSKGATAGTSYKFVKLDGASPNFAKLGTSTLVAGASPVASTLRNNMLDGSWPLQMTAYAVYPTAAAATYDAKKAPKAEFIKQMITDLSSASLHDLDAIGYFNGPATKQTLVSRVGGNNCSPLVTRANATTTTN